MAARFVRFFLAKEERGQSTMLKKFKDLTEKEILAIAIAAEEEDGRIYGEFADALREEYPSTAQMFEEMREEEVVHRDRLFAMFRQRFGDHIPLIRRENVKGFLQRRPVWLVRPLGVNIARKQAELMEMEAGRFYVLDRGYEQFRLFQAILDVGSSFVCCVREQMTWQVLQETLQLLHLQLISRFPTIMSSGEPPQRLLIL